MDNFDNITTDKLEKPFKGFRSRVFPISEKCQDFKKLI